MVGPFMFLGHLQRFLVQYCDFSPSSTRVESCWLVSVHLGRVVMRVAVVWNGRRNAERASVALEPEICIYSDTAEAPSMQLNESMNRLTGPVILKEGLGAIIVYTLLEPTQSTIIIARGSTRYCNLKISRQSHGLIISHYSFLPIRSKTGSDSTIGRCVDGRCCELAR